MFEIFWCWKKVGCQARWGDQGLRREKSKRTQFKCFPNFCWCWKIKLWKLLPKFWKASQLLLKLCGLRLSVADILQMSRKLIEKDGFEKEQYFSKFSSIIRGTTTSFLFRIYSRVSLEGLSFFLIGLDPWVSPWGSALVPNTVASIT